MKLKIIFILLTAWAYTFAQTNISEVRTNDANGVPVLIDQTVTVEGVVIAATEFGSSGPASVRDSSGAVAIYGSGFSSFVAIGDSVKLTAVVTQYNGLTELDFVSGSTFTKLGQSEDLEPKVVTINDILNQEWNGLEALESQLVRINGITISESGQFASGTNYTITDSTGSLEMRVDNNVATIIGTSIPQSKIDLVGIVGQYDPSAPYNSGYQIMPRFIDDLIIQNEPLIVNPVVASNITTESFTIYFNTVNEGDTKVKYGLTDQLELGEKNTTDLVISHSVLIDSLEPKTRYYYQVESSNEFGTSVGDLQSVTTLSGDSTYGSLNIYFNGSVDNSVAIPGNEAIGNVDFQSKVIERINSATYSLDIALYSFTLEDVANAIIAAKNRGVKVRVVYDARTIQSGIELLMNAGIQISQRPSNLSGIMHNKFMVVDARDDNIENDWVWTGSWNWTDTELDWKNNVIEVNSADLANTYTVEFEEMWGSDTDTPNSSAAKFGSQKADNTQHTFDVSGIPVELYFSPSDGTESKITNAVMTADTSIYFAILAFTSNPIGSAIETRYNSGANDLRGIITDANITGSEFEYLSSLAPGEIFDYNLTGKLHHKYGLVDASYPSSSPTTISGSHNWSNAANQDNDENTLIFYDIYIANQYMQEFKSRYNELGGTTSFTVPIITSVKERNLYPETIELYQNYPNPFNPVTTITFFIPEAKHISLNVYNTLGQKVAEIYNGYAKAGLNVFDFNYESAGRNLSSGVYIYSLNTGDNIISRKMMLLK